MTLLKNLVKIIKYKYKQYVWELFKANYLPDLWLPFVFVAFIRYFDEAHNAETITCLFSWESKLV